MSETYESAKAVTKTAKLGIIVVKHVDKMGIFLSYILNGLIINPVSFALSPSSIIIAFSMNIFAPIINKS